MTHPAPPHAPGAPGALPSRIAAVLAGGNEMGELMRAHDWASTPVGPVERWPQSLRTALNILLDSRYPMYVAWGPEFVQFYNDAYRPILGATKHPAALGRGTRETFAEIWDFIGPMFEEVMRSGRPTFLEDQILPLDRYGYVEECYFTFSYSAVRTEQGDVGGVFVTVGETTGRVLERNQHDIPFSLLYLVDEAREARLVAATGLEEGHPALMRAARLDEPGGEAWPLGEAASRGELTLVPDVRRRFGTIADRPWPEPVESAAILPIARSAQDGALDAILVMGLNPRRALDEDYRTFASLVAGQIGSAISAARAYEEERRRAEALAELDRAKTTFFSNVSHEFRTPLTLMLGPIEDLLRHPERPLAPADREKRELLQRNGLRLLKLVNTLLDFARIEAGRVHASYEPVELARATADLASAFRAAVERAGMRLVVECRDVGEPVYVDLAMWEKIVLNLLSNAAKFTLAGGTVRLSAEARGADVHLHVEDTGSGIPPGQLERIFEPFVQLDRAAHRASQQGVGLGLAISRDLARRMGGDVVASSRPGHGSRFTVLLPSRPVS